MFQFVSVCRSFAVVVVLLHVQYSSNCTIIALTSSSDQRVAVAGRTPFGCGDVLCPYFAELFYVGVFSKRLLPVSGLRLRLMHGSSYVQSTAVTTLLL